MIIGGKLLRLINDNFYNMIVDSLDQLEWFDPARRHAPVRVLAEPLGPEETVVPNLVTVSQEDLITSQAEMGSQLSEHRYLYYIDIYGESKSLALELAGDIKDILEGRYHSIGRTMPHFEVFNLTQASPEFLFHVDIEDVGMDRSRYYSKPFEKYWWVVTCDLIYTYSNETANY